MKTAEAVNHLRSHVRRLFNIAIKKGDWHAANPVSSVEKVDVPKKLNDYPRAGMLTFCP